jgi:hypothetical protein
MGLFWDLIQQSQISDARRQADSVEDRVRALELELRETQRLLREVLVRLENSVGEDLNRDGRIG